MRKTVLFTTLFIFLFVLLAAIIVAAIKLSESGVLKGPLNVISSPVVVNKDDADKLKSNPPQMNSLDEIKQFAAKIQPPFEQRTDQYYVLLDDSFGAKKNYLLVIMKRADANYDINLFSAANNDWKPELTLQSQAMDDMPQTKDQMHLRIEDINDDGHDDLLILLTAGATGNSTYTSWVYDSTQDKFVNVDLGTSPMYDPIRGAIVSHMDGGCAGGIYGNSYSRWDGLKLRLYKSITQDCQVVNDVPRFTYSISEDFGGGMVDILTRVSMASSYPAMIVLKEDGSVVIGDNLATITDWGRSSLATSASFSVSPDEKFLYYLKPSVEKLEVEQVELSTGKVNKLPDFPIHFAYSDKFQLKFTDPQTLTFTMEGKSLSFTTNGKVWH